MVDPHPSHLDEHDPAKADVRDIREEADRELDAYEDRDGLVMLMPEDRWNDFLRLTGAQPHGEQVSYRGVTFRKAAVTAVVAQEGF